MINASVKTYDLTIYSREQLENAYVKVIQEKEEAELKLKWYEEQHRLNMQKKFGSSREKITSEQISILSLPIFNEAEIEHKENVAEPIIDDEIEEETPLSLKKKKQKGKRDRDFSKLPKQVIEYKLSPEEQICPQCDGSLHEVRPEIRKELEVIPAQIVVKETHRMVYACRACEEFETSVPMVMATAPNPVIKGSIASPSLIADIMTKKYVDATPLYRQEQEYQRRSLPINRQNMSNWVIRASQDWLNPLYERMHEMLISYDVLHADETEIEVLKEPGREATTKSYMWMYRTGNGHFPIILYKYTPTRAGDNAKVFLKGFKGFLQTDAYDGYNKLLKETRAGPAEEVIIVGCFAHARRYFTETLKAVGDKSSYMYTSAYKGVEYIDRMFALERELACMSFEQKHEERKHKLKSMLNTYFAWIKTEQALALPKSSYGKAINYSFNQKEKLLNVLLDGRLELSNNRAERSIKPFVIGRKNWLFSNTPQGADSSAVVYSIIETAKENKLNPFEYLKYLFEMLPNMDIRDRDALDKLLPWSEYLPHRCHSGKK